MTQYHARDKKLDENYFNQQFSHTPNNKQSNQPNVIVEEIDESSRRSRSDSQYKESFSTGSGRNSHRRSQSQGQLPKMPISLPQEEMKEP